MEQVEQTLYNQTLKKSGWGCKSLATAAVRGTEFEAFWAKNYAHSVKNLTQIAYPSDQLGS